LEYVSLIKLRIKEPDTHRPFKIPLGIPALCVVLILPAAVYLVALTGAFASTEGAVWAAVFAIATLLSAEFLWQIIVWRKPHLKT